MILTPSAWVRDEMCPPLDPWTICGSTYRRGSLADIAAVSVCCPIRPSGTIHPDCTRSEGRSYAIDRLSLSTTCCTVPGGRWGTCLMNFNCLLVPPSIYGDRKRLSTCLGSLG